MSDLSQNQKDILFLNQLQDFIDKRQEEMPEGSYTTSLLMMEFVRLPKKQVKKLLN